MGYTDRLGVPYKMVGGQKRYIDDPGFVNKYSDRNQEDNQGAANWKDMSEPKNFNEKKIRPVLVSGKGR